MTIDKHFMMSPKKEELTDDLVHLAMDYLGLVREK